MDRVRKESHNLLQLLSKRDNFEEITGPKRARVEGRNLMSTANRYNKMLENMAIRIEERENTEKEYSNIESALRVSI